MKSGRALWLVVIAACAAGFRSFAADGSAAPLYEADYYRLETVPIPDGISLEVGGMAFMPDGTLMICTRFGEVWAVRDGKWNRFADGLNEPLGICPTGPRQVVVAQRQELTRLTDTKGKGRADLFENLADAWSYTGHMYEWTFGPVVDGEGNLCGTLSCWFNSTKHYAKPPYSGWEAAKEPAGAAPEAEWRGWSFKVTPRGEFIPWSVGLRSPNGIVASPEGELFITDNQGEYFGCCVLLHATRGAFHGHPVGLFWDKPHGTDDPFSIPLEDLDKRRKLPAILFLYGRMGQSASQPVFDLSNGKFGPFPGQLFVGDQTKSTVMRVFLEKVDGEYQGACFPFYSGFACGVNRLVFAPDGSLLAGETNRGWGSLGNLPFALQRLAWSGKVPMEIQSMRLTREGFDLVFTKPVDAATASDAGAYSFERFHYLYHRTYGSPEVEKAAVPVTSVRISEDGKTVSLVLPEFVPKNIYELHLRGVKSTDGAEVLHREAYYTLNRTLGPPHGAVR